MITVFIVAGRSAASIAPAEFMRLGKVVYNELSDSEKDQLEMETETSKDTTCHC